MKLRKRDKKNSRSRGRLREPSDSMKLNNIISQDFQKKKTEKGAEGVLGQIIAENFPNLGKETDIEIQEAQRAPFRCNSNSSSVRHIMVKLAKLDKERILKAARDK